jgi:beta-N-acetylhexosaminidase
VRKPTVPTAAPRPRRARALGGAAFAAGLLLAVTSCGNGGGGPAASPTAPHPSASASPTTGTGSISPSAPRTTTPTAPPPPPTRSPSASPTQSCVNRAYDAMTPSQRVGQLFMTAVSSTGMTASEATAITQSRAGSVILMRHTTAGTAAVRAVSDRVRAMAPAVPGATVRMLVSTDQEGGQVQVLNGPGFSAMPSAVTQGTWSPARLQSSATTWGRQLAAAGVTMDLAPVADTVPANLVGVNAPIGKLDRQYGNDPATVASHSTAFLRGMLHAGVLPAVKHFPGLGRVQGNTDLTANVRDTVTTRDDPYLQPFRSAIQAGTPFVMVSSAVYTRIDAAHQAAFSSAVMRGMLRDELGFKGVIISDDLGNAAAVQDRTPARRAVDFLAAGGTMVLTVQPKDVVAMTSAVLSRLPQDAAFRQDVADGVHRVLTAKRNAGLLTCTSP